MTSLLATEPLPQPAAATAAQPVVLIDGVPEPGLSVVAYAAEAPLDERTAELSVTPALWVRRRSLLHRPCAVALPHALSDGAIRWEVLAVGALELPKRPRRVGTDSRRLRFVDAWSDRLRRPVGSGWELTDASGLPEQVPAARLLNGDDANRSHGRYIVNGRSVYVFERGGTAWTVGDALDTLAAFADTPLRPDLLAPELRDQRLTQPIDLAGTLGDALRTLVGSAGLHVRVDHWRSGGGFHSAYTVAPVSAGRRFRLPWGGRGAGVSRVSRVDVTRSSAPPRRWVMRGARPVVEATFDLVGGWDPALEGQPDAEYGRSTSSDFTEFGAVHRRWVLNEDGAFSSAPFNRGPAFDLAALFDDPASVPAPLRLGPCLAQDTSGRRLSPVVEVSTDSGSAWSRYEGMVSMMQDRAGVVLEDATLPTAVLAAAQSSQLRVRVTATLRSPRVLEYTRWQGNPFVGPGPDRVIVAGDAYRWQRVDSTSIHANAIDLGELDADEADDRAALRRDLLERMSSTGNDIASGTVELIGAWPTIGVGDRLLDLGGPGVGLDGLPTVIEAQAVRVGSVRVRFGVSGEGRGPVTRLSAG